MNCVLEREAAKVTKKHLSFVPFVYFVVPIVFSLSNNSELRASHSLFSLLTPVHSYGLRNEVLQKVRMTCLEHSYLAFWICFVF